MDRHDVSETVTAEHVAQLHQQDLKVQDQFGCRGLTYWFDDKRKTAFCLIEAPDMKALEEMHNHAHGQVPIASSKWNPVLSNLSWEGSRIRKREEHRIKHYR